jgi:hypothetical protein
VGSSPVTLVVRKREDAMGRFEKSLWSEDARLPFPLELEHWPPVGCLGDAVCLSQRKLLVGRHRQPVEVGSEGVEHRLGHTRSII